MATVRVFAGAVLLLVARGRSSCAGRWVLTPSSRVTLGRGLLGASGLWWGGGGGVWTAQEPPPAPPPTPCLWRSALGFPPRAEVDLIPAACAQRTGSRGVGPRPPAPLQPGADDLLRTQRRPRAPGARARRAKLTRASGTRAHPPVCHVCGARGWLDGGVVSEPRCPDPQWGCRREGSRAPAPPSAKSRLRVAGREDRSLPSWPPRPRGRPHGSAVPRSPPVHGSSAAQSSPGRRPARSAVWLRPPTPQLGEQGSLRRKPAYPVSW
ncbi:formin-like protein 3 [Prionailurus viverrinus]|uniref:formin-like protein 3 n=1 Tax=Prionailurus viverrinus TaxID=61388 RepID=UPI001FF35253|nr:formin-like protein 3 [Prionailurus viverrinus]